MTMTRNEERADDRGARRIGPGPRRHGQTATGEARESMPPLVRLGTFVGMLFGARSRKGRAASHTQNIYVASSLTINQPPERVYRFWRELSNLPAFMAHVESVREDFAPEQLPRVHFRARLPAGIDLEWDAEITEDRVGDRICWRSLPDSDFENHGMVRFVPAPGDRGTEVHVFFAYLPPAGAVGRAFARLFGKLPAQQIRADLRRLKQILETGSIARAQMEEGEEARP